MTHISPKYIKFWPKQIIWESFIILEGLNIGFFNGKYSFKDCSNQLWKSESPVSTIQVSCKNIEKLVKIKLIHVGLSAFSKQVFC